MYRLHHILLLMVLLVIFSSDEAKVKDEECQPFQCGNATYAYPFWHNSNGRNEFCGYPSLGLTCNTDNEERALLHLSESEYYVQSINYDEKRLIAIDADVAHGSCPRVTKNVTLGQYDQLSFTDADTFLRFFFNCTSPPEQFLQSSTSPSCFNYGDQRSFVFINGTDPDRVSSDWFGGCMDNVLAPVHGEPSSLNGSFADLLQHGFRLNWTSGPACTACEETKGHCGHRNLSGNMVGACFCDDGMLHEKSCNDRGGIPLGATVALAKAETCQPFQCGNTTYSYPFWHNNGNNGNEYSYSCGYPFFGLTCPDNKGRAVLHLSNGDYYVQGIDYNRKHLIAIDADVAEGSCPRLTKNVTLDEHDQLSFADTDTFIRFFYNCSSPPEQLLLSSTSLSCFNYGYQRSFVFINGTYPGGVSFDWFGECIDNVLAPVHGEPSSLNGSFADLLHHGFQLNWTSGPACTLCEVTKGQCGHRNSSGGMLFACFCDDGMLHEKSCNDSDGIPLGTTVPTGKTESCQPFQCGNTTYSYPFWHINGTNGNESSFSCGYPSFGLTCPDNKEMALLHLSDSDYYVQGIDYNDKHLIAIDADVTEGSCPRLNKNVTLDEYYQLSFADTNTFLRFFFNCSSPPEQFLQSSTSPSCFNYGYQRSFVFINGTYPGGLSFDWFRECMDNVLAPVRGELINSFGDLLQDGFQLNWTSTLACTPCEETQGYCWHRNSSGEMRSVCLCDDGFHDRSCDDGGNYNLNKKVKIIIGTSVALSTIFIAAIFITVYRKNSLSWLLYLRKKYKDNSHQVETFLRTFGSIAPKRYKYYEIKNMTDNFKVKLGQGGYGGVFKGKLVDGRDVAVKVLTESEGNGEEFVNEVASIGRTYHVNVVTLLGFCSEGPRRALVYEFMPNGSLEKVIYNRKQETANPIFGWEKLLQIAVGIARGLEYLHRGCSMRILHFDIKPHNILLDDNYCPKISDFGLAKLCPNQDTGTISMLVPRGTVGYIAPEVFCRNIGRVSYKSDVYSYGMMVLEMAGGRKNIDVHADNASEIYFPHWVFKRIEQNDSLGLEDVISDEEEEIARKMIMVGLWCIQTEPGRRPSMSKVLEMLEGEVGSIEMPPTPFPSS